MARRRRCNQPVVCQRDFQDCQRDEDRPQPVERQVDDKQQQQGCQHGPLQESSCQIVPGGHGLQRAKQGVGASLLEEFQ